MRVEARADEFEYRGDEAYLGGELFSYGGDPSLDAWHKRVSFFPAPAQTPASRELAKRLFLGLAALKERGLEPPRRGYVQFGRIPNYVALAWSRYSGLMIIVVVSGKSRYFKLTVRGVSEALESASRFEEAE